MFHKCKSGFNEYWSHNFGLFTLLKTVVAMDFYNFEALPGFFFLFRSHNSVVHMFAYIQNVSSLFVTDVWGQPITPKFKGQTVKETYFMGNVCL